MASRVLASQPTGSRWAHRLAVVTASATLLLIFVGGLVTNSGSALAVPDWPTTFGQNMFLYPWSKMVGGIFYEHSHRLIGSTVGMLTVALALVLWFTEARRWVRVLGLAAVAGVVMQGVLGGLRVVLLEQPLAIVHGCVAPAFLALLVSLAVITSAWWAAPATPLRDGAPLRARALVTVPLVYVQLVFGALLTHTGARLDAHLIGGAVVTVAIGILASGVLRAHPERTDLCRPALLLLGLLILQLGLGFGAYVRRFTLLGAGLDPALALALPTTHRLAGALVLAVAIVLSLRILRLTAVAQTAMQPADAAPRRFVADMANNHSRQVPA